jgi:hypothetical protein
VAEIYGQALDGISSKKMGKNIRINKVKKSKAIPVEAHKVVRC